MEVLLNRPSTFVKSKIKAEIIGDHEGIVEKLGSIENKSSCEMRKPNSPSQKIPSLYKQENQLESTKAEMGEVKEENEKLKLLLSRIVKDYQSLETHLFDIVKQEQAKKLSEDHEFVSDQEEPNELVSLSLGTRSNSGSKREFDKITTKLSDDNDKVAKGLTLRLGCNFESNKKSSTENEPVMTLSSQDNSEDKEEEVGEASKPSKGTKNSITGDDEVSEQPQVKKARVSVRVRCDAPTLNDGCQWRKYGQKIAKGNPCPRAYYRCTVAPACPVRKQVQRCAEDMSILITTYEGTHNHTLPFSATAMASTTSAAANMLISPSSSSTTLSTSIANLHSPFSDGPRYPPNPFHNYLPNTSISSNPTYPTVTLDLTSHPSSTNQYNNKLFNNALSRSFNFSPSETAIPTSWNSWNSNNVHWLSRSSIGSSLSHGRQFPQAQETLFHHPLLQKPTDIGIGNSDTGSATNHGLTDTIAKALTTDPSFQSALAAALTSYVGGHGMVAK